MADPGHIPGPVIIDSCVAVRLIWKLANGKTVHNMLHGRSSGNPNFTQSIVDNLFTAMLTSFTGSGFASRLDPTTVFTAIGVRYMGASSPGGPGFGEWQSSISGLAGTATTPPGPLPAQVALCVSLKTGLSGQANRGRVYLSGWSEAANIAGGQCDPTNAQDAVDFVGAIAANMSSAGFPLAIAHPARAGYTGSTGTVHPARAAGTVPVTSVTKLNDTWDTVRLRNHV